MQPSLQTSPRIRPRIRPDACPICETPREAFADLPGRPKVHCPGCGSVERHRAFARAYRERFGQAALAGKRVLALRPDGADTDMLRAFGAAEVVRFDAFPRDTPDVVGDPAAMEFSDAAFDIVFSNGFLATIRDPKAVAAELRRVLKPDGVAMIYESAGHGTATREVEDRARQASWYGEAVLDDYGVGLLREWNVADLEVLLSEHFGLGVFEAPASDGRPYIWFFGAQASMLGGPFLDEDERASLLAAFGSTVRKAPPPYACTVCAEVFDEPVRGEDCPSCGAKARQRALPAALERVRALIDPALAARLPLLTFALVVPEKRCLDRLFASFRQVSLFGGYGKDNMTGVDARDLSRFGDESFSGTFSVGLYDYFPEHDQALAEAFRVTAPGGIFLLLILPARLRPGMRPPVVEHLIEGRADYYEYLPQGTTLSSVSVGRGWFLEAMRRAGFEADSFTVTDPATGIVNTWFLGRKPVRTAPFAAAAEVLRGLWSRLRGSTLTPAWAFVQELGLSAPGIV